MIFGVRQQQSYCELMIVIVKLQNKWLLSAVVNRLKKRLRILPVISQLHLKFAQFARLVCLFQHKR